MQSNLQYKFKTMPLKDMSIVIDDLKILFCQSFVEQHALPRGLESHLLVAIPALPLSVPRVTLPCNQVVIVVVVVVVDVVVVVFVAVA